MYVKELTSVITMDLINGARVRSMKLVGISFPRLVVIVLILIEIFVARGVFMTIWYVSPSPLVLIVVVMIAFIPLVLLSFASLFSIWLGLCIMVCQ